MFALDSSVRTGDEAVRLVRALGAHRYVRASLHAVHALAFDAVVAAGLATGEVADACRWAEETLNDDTIEPDSKDPRLYRNATLPEVVSVLTTFWTPGNAADLAVERLLEMTLLLGLEVPRHDPFDERVEDDLHPVLVDAGWELYPLADLDPVRHRGVIGAYDEPILFEGARFEEANAIPPRVTLQELPALGLVELLRGVNGDGELVEPFVLWAEGDATYHDYVVRGARRAAKLV